MPKRGKPARKACRNCKAIVPYDVKECPYCGSKDFTEEFMGFVIIIDENKSEIAKKKNLKEGLWAIKII